MSAHKKDIFLRVLKKNQLVFSFKSLEYINIEYMTGIVVVIKTYDDILTFEKFIEIYLKENEVYFRLPPLQIRYFDDHVSAYYVRISVVRIIKNVNELPEIHPCQFVTEEILNDRNAVKFNLNDLNDIY